MMYISKARICDTVQACQLAKEGFYAGHKAVWRLFADDPDRKRDFLYRQERGTGGNSLGLDFLIVSRREPDLVSGWRVQTKPYAPQLDSGDLLRFRLTANPTRIVTGEDGKKRRVDVVMHAKHELKAQGVKPEDMPPQAVLADQAGRGWLADRAEGLGLEILEPSLLISGYRLHRRPQPGARGPIRFSTLDYEGIARVTNPETLRTALFEGVGKAKGFGCGLLLVRRA